MHEFEVLADAVRRRLLGVLALGEQPAGVLTDIARGEFGISQPAVSQHLRVLRENGFATVRPEGARRIYALDPAGPDAAARALAELTDPLGQRLDALHTEVARGRRAAGRAAQHPTAHGPAEPGPAERQSTERRSAAQSTERKDAS